MAVWRFALVDDRGVEYVEDWNLESLPPGWALCGTCNRAWNDSKSTSVTPTPAGRCPFEYEHEDTDNAMTVAQEATLRRLCERYHVEFDPRHYTPQFDLPSGYVAGWVGGSPGTLYVGVAPEGDASS